MKRSIILILVLLLALVPLSGCGKSGSGGMTDGTSDGVESTEAPGQDGQAAQDVATRLQEDYGDTAWFAGVDRIDEVIKLRHPVIEIHFAASVNEVREGWLDEAMQAVAELGLDGYYLDVYGTDGPAGSSGVGGGESVQLPAAPASVDEVAGWMDAAYGPGSGDPIEDWYGHITGYDFETDAWDGEAVLVVKTDLADVGFEWSPEREMVDLIKWAVSSSGLTFATNLRIEDATEENLSTGEFRSDMVPYSGY